MSLFHLPSEEPHHDAYVHVLIGSFLRNWASAENEDLVLVFAAVSKRRKESIVNSKIPPNRRWNGLSGVGRANEVESMGAANENINKDRRGHRHQTAASIFFVRFRPVMGALNKTHQPFREISYGLLMLMCLLLMLRYYTLFIIL